jgi:hypothetical protein
MDGIKTVKGLAFSGKKSEFMFLATIVHYECNAILTDPAYVAQQTLWT